MKAKGSFSNTSVSVYDSFSVSHLVFQERSSDILSFCLGMRLVGILIILLILDHCLLGQRVLSSDCQPTLPQYLLSNTTDGYQYHFINNVDQIRLECDVSQYGISQTGFYLAIYFEPGFILNQTIDLNPLRIAKHRLSVNLLNLKGFDLDLKGSI